MTKKHYVELAKELKQARRRMYEEGMPPDLVERVMAIFMPVLSNVLKGENPRFDADKFFNAVYKQKGEK